MISIHKLEQLPRSLRLRKLAKLFGEAEYRLCGGGSPEAAELEALTRALDLIAGDTALSPALRAALPAARPLPPDPAGLRRALNTVRHILLTETGRVPADWDFIGPAGDLDPARRVVFPGMRIYLEDLRSPFNVGAIFRTAESFGVERICLSPLCADPGHPRASRTAMGCVSLVPWERLDFPPPGPCFALETGGIPLRSFPFPRRGLMIAGSEELGVSPAALTRADASLGRLSIPTLGAKGSLNVTVAAGIALCAWAEALGK